MNPTTEISDPRLPEDVSSIVEAIKELDIDELVQALQWAFINNRRLEEVQTDNHCVTYTLEKQDDLQ